MKIWLASLVLAFFGMTSASAAAPTPMLWKAQGEAGTIYLLGAFHLLKAEDYPLHPKVEAAYDEADRLVFEVDPAEMSSPDTVRAIQALAKFNDTRTLRRVISAETTKKLKAFLGSEAAVAASDPFKPWFIGLNIALGSMASIGLDAKLGLDQHFMQRAATDHKPVSGLETVQEQMGAMDGSPLAEQELMLIEALAPLAEKRERILEMHDLWRQGDVARLERLVNEDMLERTPRMYELLNRERNQKWLPQVIAMLGENQTTLIVVGTMHLIGEDGLVEQLQRRGVVVERVEVGIALQALDEAA